MVYQAIFNFETEQDKINFEKAYRERIEVKEEKPTEEIKTKRGKK